MDINYSHSTNILLLTACHNEDAYNLFAITDDHSVHVLHLTDDNLCQTLAVFHIGSRLTALAWSPRSVSPSSSDDWFVELVVAGADLTFRLLSKSASGAESTFTFGGGLSGHRNKVTDLVFNGGRGDDSHRYIASVSEDKNMIVWDMYPTIDMSSQREFSNDASPSPDSRLPPTEYLVPFAHPLISVCSHPDTAKEFLVADRRGSIFLIDWRSDPNDLTHPTTIELQEPRMLSDVTLGLANQLSGSVDWRRDTPDIVGAVYGSRFSIWDISKLQGGKPSTSSASFPDGGHRFRWCHTYPEYFAISTQSPLKGAIVHVHNMNYVQAPPTVFNVAQKPHYVKDFDFLNTRGIPRLAVAVGRSVIIFSIGEAS